MTFTDGVHLALRNLREAKLRTALTTMGVSIGIASLSGMVSLGVGLQDQFVGRFTRSGMFNTITVLPPQDRPGALARAALGRRGFGGRAGGGGSGGPADAAGAPTRTLNDEALKELSGLARVSDAYPNLRVPVQIAYGQFSEFAVAAGVPMSSRDEGPFQTFAAGSFFANDTDNTCLISLDLAKRVDEGNPTSLVGREVTLSYAASTGAAGGAPVEIQKVDAAYRIAGIIEREAGPALGGVAGVSNLMIPLRKAKEIGARSVSTPQSLIGGRADTYTSLTVKVEGAQFTQDVEDRIKGLGFAAFSLNDALQGAKRAFIILDIVLSLIGSIALAVSSLGIVNTMVMSILERTREIGIMKAIGGSDRDIGRIFLIEASVIGLLGGLAGVALGWAVGRVINFGANVYIQSQGGTAGNLFSLPLWLVGGAVGFSIAVSLAAGSYPASRAARLDPIQALRHD